jgi:uncharacterized protein YsxB (DUF464 family)
MDGHAQSGEKGHDLVCASASILAYTLAQFVKNMNDAGQIRYPTLELTEGHTLIACSPPNRISNSVKLAFDTVCAGFELLARDYPDNISYEIRGKI